MTDPTTPTELMEALAFHSDGELYRDLWKQSSSNAAQVAKRANEMRAQLTQLRAKAEGLAEALVKIAADRFGGQYAHNSLELRDIARAALQAWSNGDD